VVRATRRFALLALSLMLGLRMLEVPDRLDRLLDKGMVLVFILQVGLWVQAALQAWLLRRQRASLENNNAQLQTNLSMMRWGLQLVLWTVVTLMVLDNLGFNITTLVASLGIGGVAVALCRTSWATCSPRCRSRWTSPSWWATSSSWTPSRAPSSMWA
jgi:small-conductance mechanosensitive channel